MAYVLVVVSAMGSYGLMFTMQEFANKQSCEYAVETIKKNTHELWRVRSYCIPKDRAALGEKETV